MELSRFVAEAQRLSRPCIVFRDSGNGSPDAYWHGTTPGLCLSIKHVEQWLNVYVDGELDGRVEVSSKSAISNAPLYAESSISLPPVDAVFQYGSDAVAEYLQKNEWPRDEPFNDNFPDSTPGEYERIWQGNCPIYQSGIPVVSGGWHMPWPDGDWEEFVDHELIAWTLRDAEPWVEVFNKDDNYVVKCRTS